MFMSISNSGSGLNPSDSYLESLNDMSSRQNKYKMQLTNKGIDLSQSSAMDDQYNTDRSVDAAGSHFESWNPNI